jgi:hypothetical protein
VFVTTSTVMLTITLNWADRKQINAIITTIDGKVDTLREGW